MTVVLRLRVLGRDEWYGGSRVLGVYITISTHNPYSNETH